MVKSAEKSPKYNPAGGMDGTRQCGTFIDWRGLPIAHAAALALGLTPLNLVVWAKTNAGMGSLYRSQHELLPLFKKGIASHINNVSLGKRGRHRTNLWIYPGASSVASDARARQHSHAGQAAPDQCRGARMKSAPGTGRVRCAIYTRMHVAGLAVFEPPSADTEVFAAFRDHVKSRLLQQAGSDDRNRSRMRP